MSMNILAFVYRRLKNAHIRRLEQEIRKEFKLDPSVDLNYPEHIFLCGDITIGKHTYINGARIVSGRTAKIFIGEWCAIGHNVNIIGRTHNPEHATGNLEDRPTIHKDIIIGDRVWIGTNVFIREGVSLGNDCVIGANSVVTMSFPDRSVIAGCPAKVLRTVEEK